MMMKTYPCSTLLKKTFIALVAAVWALSAHASSSWDEPAGGDFGVAGNWSDGVPKSGEAANFDLDATYTVTFDDDFANDRAVISDGAVTFDLDEQTYSLTNTNNVASSTAAISFVVGQLADTPATLTLTGEGTLEAVQARIGNGAGRTGTLILDDATLATTGFFTIGWRGGTGNLTLQNGGVLDASSLVIFGGQPGASTSTLHITGEGSLLNAAGQAVIFSSNANNESSGLIENGGAIQATTVTISTTSASNADVTLTGSGSSISATSAITISTEGTLTVSDGAKLDGRLSMPRASASATITGSTTEWEHASGRTDVQMGAVTVQQGATASLRDLWIGGSSAGTGTMTVTGADSTVTVETVDLRLGTANGADGTLNITEGGALQTPAAYIGHSQAGGAVGVVHVSGEDSIFTATNLVQIGQNAGNTGTINVSDEGSVVVTNALTVGQSGIGNLNISGAATVSSAASTIGVNSDSVGTVTITGAGSSWTLTSGSLTVGNNGTGTLILEDGGSFGGQVNVGETGTLTGDGGIVQGSITNAGLVAPGNSAGTLSVWVSYTQTATGVLEIELGGTTAGTEYDQLQSILGGDAVLDGTLSLLSLNDFMPSAGQSFQILNNFNDFIGEFDTINAFALDSGLSWDFDNLYTTGTISVIPEPATMAALLGALALGLALWRRQSRRLQLED